MLEYLSKFGITIGDLIGYGISFFCGIFLGGTVVNKYNNSSKNKVDISNIEMRNGDITGRDKHGK